MKTTGKVAVVLLLVLAVGVTIALKTRKPAATPDTLVAQDASGRPLPALLEFGGTECIPCKQMAPILEALREDFAGQFEVVFIDVWKNRQAAGPYGIKLIPTQIFFDKEGNELLSYKFRPA